MTKEELLNIKEIMKDVQQKRSIENIVLAYQTTMDLELQRGKEKFITAVIERLLVGENATAIMRKTTNVDYNFRNHMFQRFWRVMLDSQKLTERERNVLILDPTLCPYDDIYSFGLCPLPGENSIEGYIRKARILKSLENLGFKPDDIREEKDFFQIEIFQNNSRVRK